MDIPHFSWPKPEMQIRNCPQNRTCDDFLNAVSESDVAAVERAMSEWEQYCGEKYFYAIDLQMKAWRFVLTRRHSHWASVVRAAVGWLNVLHGNEALLREFYGTLNFRQPAKIAFSTLAMAAAVAGDDAIFGGASFLALRFGESIEITAFYSAICFRQEEIAAKRFGAALQESVQFGTFYPGVLKVLNSKAFTDSLSLGIIEDVPISLEREQEQFKRLFVPPF